MLAQFLRLCRNALVIVTILVMFHHAKSIAAPSVPPPSITVTILHDNDLHGHLLPFAYTELGKSTQEQPSRGGAARRATLIRQLRASIENPTFVIDSGDIATRGPLINAYEGIADVETMNAVGYDLAEIGNNEFKLKDGVEQTDYAGAQRALSLVIKRSRFPWICANVTQSDGAFLDGVEPYVVRDFHGVRIGFLGLTTQRSQYYPQTKGLIFTNPIVAAQHWIPEARKNCDILIAVTHIGTVEDQELAAQTSGLDAIIGGDSHTFLYQPLEVKNSEGLTVPIVQDGEFGVDLGRFDLHLTEDSSGSWHLASYKDVLLPIDPTIPEAKDVQEVLNPYVRPLIYTVGHINEIAATPKARVIQTTQIVVDALRQQTNSDYALNGVGDGFFEVFRTKDVSFYQVHAIMPFHDNIVTAKLTGAQLAALIKAQPTTVTSGNLANLNPASIYQAAFVDFEALGTYKIPLAAITETGIDERAAVINYLHSTAVAQKGKQ